MEESQKSRIMRILDVDEKQADEILAYDKAVDRGEKTPYDLSPEKEKEVRKYRQADRKPTAYNFPKKERKPNATKGGLIQEFFTYLSENCNFDVTNCVILNKERQIAFTIGENDFELTLVQKRKKKGGE